MNRTSAPERKHSDPAIQSGISSARLRSLQWLDRMQAPGQPDGVSRISAAQDAVRWPGMLLPGTYNAVMARELLGDLSGWTVDRRQALAAWLESHRRADGVFRIPGMTDDAVFKKPRLSDTWEYIDFHVSNYCQGAVQALCPARPPVLDFARPFLEPLHLKAWLSERDLRDPWQEGNNIVNLGSFLLGLAAQGDAEAEAVHQALDLLFAWHDRLQEPSTGFWGVGQAHDATALLHAMAGSMHNYHLWYATGRPLPYQERAIDYALSRPPTIHSACIDVDLIDSLTHGHACLDYRRPETEEWLRALLVALLDLQADDGGFPDEPARSGQAPRRQDGWVGGYTEPQGLSNTFSTWFRWIAIAMAARCLWPDWQAFEGGWRFRRMVGIGYAMEPSLSGTHA
jgi:hypothetical protein